MKKGNRLQDHPGKLIFLAIVASLVIYDINSSSSTSTDFPKADPSKGQAWGFNYEKNEYKYESYWPKDKPIPDSPLDIMNSKSKRGKKSTYGPNPIHIHSIDVQSAQDETDEEIDSQEIIDYYGH